MTPFYLSQNFKTRVALYHANFIDLSSELKVVREETVDIDPG